MNISSIVYKVTGVMSQKQIMSSCEALGRRLIVESRERPLGIEDFRRCITDIVGPKKAKNIIVTDDVEEYYRFMQGSTFSQRQLKNAVEENKAFVVKNPITRKTILFISRPDMQVGETLNVVTHEMEHTLQRTTSLKSKLSNILAKILPNSLIKKINMRYASVVAEAYTGIMGLLCTLGHFVSDGKIISSGFSSCKPTVSDIIGRSKIYDETCIKPNLNMVMDIVTEGKTDRFKFRLLKIVRSMVKDESRAYKVGGQIEKEFFNETEKQSNSQLLSVVLEEGVKVLDSEVKKMRKNIWVDRFRRLFPFLKSE